MQNNTKRRTGLSLIAVLALLLGGTIAMVSPAGAALSTDWKQIWKHEIKPRADKRYYTKAKVDTKLGAYETKVDHATSLGAYETKAEHDASLGNYYTKAQSDANYYTKGQSDAKYATKTPAVIRGMYFAGTTSGAGALMADSISYGVQLTANPIVHYIPVATAVPAGCSGSAAAPDAQPGHLCIFEGIASNTGARNFYSPTNYQNGVAVYAYTNVAGQGYFSGTWALRPVGVVAKPTATSPGEAKPLPTPAG